jgi:hypothetical protein
MSDPSVTTATSTVNAAGTAIAETATASVDSGLAIQDLLKLKVEELTPLTPEVISRQVRND